MKKKVECDGNSNLRVECKRPDEGQGLMGKRKGNESDPSDGNDRIPVVGCSPINLVAPI